MTRDEIKEVCRQGLEKSLQSNRKTMTDINTADKATPVIADVKHYVINKDADGNEVRVEVTEEQVKKDFSN